MRIRVTAAMFSAAVVVSALALPATAQAAERPGAPAGLGVFAAKSVHPYDSLGSMKFSKAVINGGKDIVLGVTTKKNVTVTYVATSSSGVALTEAFLWQGTDSSSTDTITGSLGTDDDPACVESTSQTGVYACTAVFHINAASDFKDNGAAGTWKLFLGGYDLYANASYDDNVATTKIKRASQLTVNASPEPVKKGKTITVVGSLKRANWTNGTTMRLCGAEGVAAVPQEDQPDLHHPQVRYQRHRRRPQVDHQGHGRRLLPLLVPDQHHDRRVLGGRRLRRRQVTSGAHPLAQAPRVHCSRRPASTRGVRHGDRAAHGAGSWAGCQASRCTTPSSRIRVGGQGRRPQTPPGHGVRARAGPARPEHRR